MTATEQDAPAVLEADDRPTITPLYIDERSVYERVLAIIGELPAIGKTQRNTQQNFMFRGHDDVMNALNPLLAKHGVFIVPDVMERITAERQTSGGKTMYEVNLHVKFRFFGAGGDVFIASGWGEGTDMGDKATSKAMTMAFKYVIAEVFALATAEVSDADAGSPEETTRGTSPPRQPRQEAAQRPKPEFDPAKHMLDGAIIVRTEEDADALARTINDWDPDQNWNAVEEYVLLHLFGKPYDELDGKQKREYYTRLANAVVKVSDLNGGGDFPPPDLVLVEEAWAWAFNGVQVALERPEPDADGPEVPAEPEAAAEPENGVQADDK
jgi:hypothetical protein